jgi:two-component system phosphate regulon sensor histidine kinase PhoR
VKKHSPLRHLLHVALALAAFILALSSAFYLTGFLYRRAGLHPHPLLALIVNTLLSFGVLVLALNLIGLLFWRGRKNVKDFFTPITDALGRIATGDFTVRVEENLARGPFADLARSVNQTAAKLDQLEKMRQEFVSNVSHEIQSPLTSIRGFAGALRQEHLTDAERRHYLEIIEAESQRLSRLGANLLKLASLESNQVQPARRTYRLDHQIRDLILACETQWTEKHLDVEADLAETDVTADEDLLSQVWTNLLHNAVKFTPEGGRIRVTLRRRDARIELSIADTGIGISAGDQPRIFERFYKADRSRRTSAGGNGLGLAIVKRIVEMHQGTIAVQSEPEAGAEFVVNLPAV